MYRMLAAAAAQLLCLPDVVHGDACTCPELYWHCAKHECASAQYVTGLLALVCWLCVAIWRRMLSRRNGSVEWQVLKSVHV